MTVSFHILIPARYAASRLPGKPLALIAGKPMIQWVVECARRSDAQTVAVATDDERIARAAESCDARAVMTAAAHPSGTDRIAEAIDILKFGDDEIVVNLQGDEPQMPAALINQVAALLTAQPSAAIATASAPLAADQADDPSVVKVVTDRDGYAQSFSRTVLAGDRDRVDDGANDRDSNSDSYSDSNSDTVTTPRRHLGIYAYRCGYLRAFAARPPCESETRERLEQLRALWYGDKIACCAAVEIPPAGVDTPADLARTRAALES